MRNYIRVLASDWFAMTSLIGGLVAVILGALDVSVIPSWLWVLVAGAAFWYSTFKVWSRTNDLAVRSQRLLILKSLEKVHTVTQFSAGQMAEECRCSESEIVPVLELLAKQGWIEDAKGGYWRFSAETRAMRSY